MLKLRFSEPLHKQYMDGKISLCKYECTVYDNSSKCIVAKFTVTGTAKCSPNDKVDAEFGRKLADSRAKLNGYRVAAKFIPLSFYDKEDIADLDDSEKQLLIDSWIRDKASMINQAVEYLDFIGQMRYLKAKELSHIEDICSE